MQLPLRYSKNLHTLKKSGSLIFCDSCNMIIGSINIASYENLCLHINCSCGTKGALQFSKTEILERKSVNRTPAYLNGVYTCSKCNTPLLSVIYSRVKNYSFYVECICGEIYDYPIEHHNPLSETLNRFKQEKVFRLRSTQK